MAAVTNLEVFVEIVSHSFRASTPRDALQHVLDVTGVIRVRAGSCQVPYCGETGDRRMTARATATEFDILLSLVTPPT